MKISPIQERINFIEKNIGEIKDGQVIIDLGCGTGLLSKEIYDTFNIKVIGIDLDSANIEIAQKNHPNGEYIVADINDTKIPVADIIICSEVLEHIEQPALILEKIKKQLKDGGRLFITIPNGYGPWELFENQPLEIARDFIEDKPFFQKVYFWLRSVLHAQAKDSLNSGIGSRHIQRFTLAQMEKMLQDTGFKVIYKENTNFLINLLFFRFFKERFPLVFKIDQMFCNIIPFSFASGWGIVAVKKN